MRELFELFVIASRSTQNIYRLYTMCMGIMSGIRTCIASELSDIVIDKIDLQLAK